MKVNGAVPATAGTVTFTGIGSIALLGSFFILLFLYEFQRLLRITVDENPVIESFREEEEGNEQEPKGKELGRRSGEPVTEK